MIRKLILGTLAGLAFTGVSVSSGVLAITMEWQEN